jgi:enoyl-CoA hydratase
MAGEAPHRPCLPNQRGPRSDEIPDYRVRVPIHYEKTDEHIVQITIDRPPRNAMDMYHFRDLANAWRDFGADNDAWVAIITGTGESFCVGADLKTYIPQVTDLQKKIAAGEVTEIDGCKLEDGTYAVLRGVKLYKPIIGAVNGFCTAGGMEMLGGIDIRISCPEAQFAVMEPKRGLFAGGGTTVRLPRQIPFPQAMEFLLCADLIPAQRAMEMGLLNQIVPRDELLDAAYAMARRITANAPLAVQATKESVIRGLAMTMKDAYKLESEISSFVFQTEDAKEGPKAFAEKRPPKWQGR